ncbi:hypothetical protein ACYZUC_03780 [Pseudomonas sp. GT1P32]
MTTPSLRILVVDAQHSRRLSIEKMFNVYGYYRIAPLESLKEFFMIIENAIEPFDLVVLNSAMYCDESLNIENFCRRSPSIRNVLIYGEQPASFPMMVLAGDYSFKLLCRLSSVPDHRAIKTLMELVDSPTRDSTVISFSKAASVL